MADQDEKLLALLSRCNSGDDDACESLWKECGRIMRAYLLRRSYFRGKSEAIEDVTQQVFMKLLKGGLKNFRGTSDYQFLGYLKTITINEANTFLSKTEQETEVSTDR